MKKLKHESELVKEAILAGMAYGEERGVVEFVQCRGSDSIDRV